MMCREGRRSAEADVPWVGLVLPAPAWARTRSSSCSSADGMETCVMMCEVICVTLAGGHHGYGVRGNHGHWIRLTMEAGSIGSAFMF